MKDKIFNMMAKTQQGLEPLLAAELKEIGAHNIEEHNRVVSFEGDLETLYKANLYLRTALKVLVPIAKFKANGDHELYEEVRRIDWENYMDVDGTLAVDSSVRSEFFSENQFVNLKTKDAIVDEFRDKYGKRPSVDTEFPDLRINLHIFQKECTISLDSSGESLHKRGYRMEANMAPLNEVTAAAMIILSGWDKKSTFIDPMCGSGTLLIEAGLMARNIPPGMFKEQFGFMKWKNYDADLWHKIKDEAKANIKECEAKIIGGDAVFRVIEKARNNITRAGLDEDIIITNKRFEEHKPSGEGGTVIINPPYGERLELEDIAAFYKLMGDTLKQNFTGYDVWIISSNKEAMKKIGLAASKRLTIWNGPLECKYHKFEMYRGTKDPRKMEQNLN